MRDFAAEGQNSGMPLLNEVHLYERANKQTWICCRSMCRMAVKRTSLPSRMTRIKRLDEPLFLLLCLSQYLLLCRSCDPWLFSRYCDPISIFLSNLCCGPRCCCHPLLQHCICHSSDTCIPERKSLLRPVQLPVS